MAQSILEEVDADAQAHEVQRRERGGKDLVGRRSEIVGAGVPPVREVHYNLFASLAEPVDLGSQLFECGPTSGEVLDAQDHTAHTTVGENAVEALPDTFEAGRENSRIEATAQEAPA